MNGPFIEGHEAALIFLGGYIFAVLTVWGAYRHYKDCKRILSTRKEPTLTLRPFNERDAEYDPHADENNFGRH